MHLLSASSVCVLLFIALLCQGKAIVSVHRALGGAHAAVCARAAQPQVAVREKSQLSRTQVSAKTSARVSEHKYEGKARRRRRAGGLGATLQVSLLSAQSGQQCRPPSFLHRPLQQSAAPEAIFDYMLLQLNLQETGVPIQGDSLSHRRVKSMAQIGIKSMSFCQRISNKQDGTVNGRPVSLGHQCTNTLEATHERTTFEFKNVPLENAMNTVLNFKSYKSVKFDSGLLALSSNFVITSANMRVHHINNRRKWRQQSKQRIAPEDFPSRVFTQFA
ncbi:hypothetical protein Q8A73_006488 [Channa argus]|nr:hypothetical protein Q8A73_006488 [Channa argus]